MKRVLFSLFVVVALACTNDDYILPVNPAEPMNPEDSIRIPDSTFTYLALGDSYTIGESVSAENRFPVQLHQSLSAKGYKLIYPEIIAQTGWTTDELAGAIERAKQNKQYNLVTLLIGVNNQYRGRGAAEYQVEFRALLQTAIEFANNDARNVIVVSIPDYGVTPFGKNNNPAQIAKEIDAFNAINLAETENANARYVDITPISREASNNATLIANDGLHPSAEMYKLWVEQILPQAQEILNGQ